jgi:transcriptional regulator with XRE-family HTH domain
MIYDVKKIREWTGLNQAQFAERIGISRAALSKIESGSAAASLRLLDSIEQTCTPSVLFLTHGEHTPIVVRAMIAADQIDALEHEPDKFRQALKQGLRLAVITDKRGPFLMIVEEAEKEAGIQIKTRFISVQLL